MLEFIGLIVWFLFNAWLSFVCIAMVFVPINVGGRSLDLEEVIVFLVATSLCIFSWHKMFSGVSIQII